MTKTTSKTQQTSRGDQKLGISSENFRELKNRFSGYDIVDIGKHVARLNIIKTFRKLGLELSDKPEVFVNDNLNMLIVMPSFILNGEKEDLAIGSFLDATATNIMKNNDTFIAKVKAQPAVADLLRKAEVAFGSKDLQITDLISSFAPVFMDGKSVLKYEFENEEDSTDVLTITAPMQKLIDKGLLIKAAMGQMGSILPGGKDKSLPPAGGGEGKVITIS